MVRNWGRKDIQDLSKQANKQTKNLIIFAVYLKLFLKN